MYGRISFAVQDYAMDEGLIHSFPLVPAWKCLFFEGFALCTRKNPIDLRNYTPTSVQRVGDRQERDDRSVSPCNSDVRLML